VRVRPILFSTARAHAVRPLGRVQLPGRTMCVLTRGAWFTWFRAAAAGAAVAQGQAGLQSALAALTGNLGAGALQGGGALGGLPFMGMAQAHSQQPAAQLQQTVTVLTQLVQVLLLALHGALATNQVAASQGLRQAHPANVPLHFLGGGAALGGHLGAGGARQVPLATPGPSHGGAGGRGGSHQAGRGAHRASTATAPPPAAHFAPQGDTRAPRGATNGRWGGMNLWRTVRAILYRAGRQGLSIRGITADLQSWYAPGVNVNVGSLRNTLCQHKDVFVRLGNGVWSLVELQNQAEAAPGPRQPASRRRRNGGEDGDGGNVVAPQEPPGQDNGGGVGDADADGADADEQAAAAGGRRKRATRPPRRNVRQRMAGDEGVGRENGAEAEAEAAAAERQEVVPHDQAPAGQEDGAPQGGAMAP
jgi:hypothetical protein